MDILNCNTCILINTAAKYKTIITRLKRRWRVILPVVVDI